MTSKKLILENFNKLERMGIEWIDPWEKPLHEIYNEQSLLFTYTFSCLSLCRMSIQFWSVSKY